MVSRWVWLVGVGGIYGCGLQEVGVGGIYECVVVRRYIDFLIILLIPTPLVLFCSSIPTFCSFFKCFSFFI